VEPGRPGEAGARARVIAHNQSVRDRLERRLFHEVFGHKAVGVGEIRDRSIRPDRVSAQQIALRHRIDADGRVLKTRSIKFQISVPSTLITHGNIPRDEAAVADARKAVTSPQLPFRDKRKGVVLPRAGSVGLMSLRRKLPFPCRRIKGINVARELVLIRGQGYLDCVPLDKSHTLILF
jgi:hypothetical protein